MAMLCLFGQYINTFPNTAKLPELIIDQTDNIQRTQTRVHIITPYRTFQQTQTVSIILDIFFYKIIFDWSQMSETEKKLQR